MTAGPAFDRLNYGFYETRRGQAAMKDLAKDLEKNAPVKVTNGSRTFLIPASRVHYVVCEEVTRPKDEPEGRRGGREGPRHGLSVQRSASCSALWKPRLRGSLSMRRTSWLRKPHKAS